MMGQAIVTKYRGPTNTRGSRFIASAEAWREAGAFRVTTPMDYALNSEDNHTRAARALAEKRGWHGSWIGGVLPGGEYVFVRVEGAGLGGAVAFTVEKGAK